MSFFDKMAEQFSRLNKKMKSRQRAVSVLSAVVVFVTVYALILPAITLDKDTAQQQPGIQVAASGANLEESGTSATAAEPEETAAPEEPEEIVVEEPGQIEQGTEEIIEEPGTGDKSAALTEESSKTNIADNDEDATSEETEEGVAEILTDDTIATEILSPEDLEAAVAAGEIELITEKTQLVYEYVDEEYEKNKDKKSGEDSEERTDDVDDGYFVYAEIDASAKLPAGVELQVREITEESDPEMYATYREKALAEMQDKYDDNTGIRFAKFYDIGFIYDGKRIEPSGDVKVRIEYKKEIEVEKDVKVDALHFDKENDERPEVIESEVNPDNKEKDGKNEDEESEPMKAVEFTSNRF